LRKHQKHPFTAYPPCCYQQATRRFKSRFSQIKEEKNAGIIPILPDNGQAETQQSRSDLRVLNVNTLKESTMATKGQMLSNPLTGDGYEFIETAADTNGGHVSVKATVKSKGKQVPDHIHVAQDETFEVLSGRLTVWADGKATTLEAGEKISLPRNQPHNHYNTDEGAVTYLHTVTPALDFEHLLENLVGLAADGKGKNGKFGLLQELVTLKYLDSKTYLAGVPIGVQKILMNTLGPVGRMLGYRALYKKYSGIEK
jgi:quercetin dioxygenase-like cupin family protein